MRAVCVGVLAFHGDVSEHIAALEKAASRARISIRTSEVRAKDDLQGLGGLVIPGGESTTLQILCEREKMFPAMRRVKNIFGTCAGAIMLAKSVHNRKSGQKTLALMDIEIDRNAYGRQIESAEKALQTTFGPIRGMFIRAPKILSMGAKVRALAHSGQEIVACEERVGDRYYLAACFHPELTTIVFHEHFLRQLGATSRD